MRLFSCVNDIVLVSLLLNLNKFLILFCFHCWLNTGWINLVVKQLSRKVSTGRKLGPYFCHVYLPNLEKCSGVHRKNSSTFLLFWAENRSSRPDVFCKKVILRSFAKFTGKQLCQSLFFNKVADLRHIWFPVNFAKFLRTPPVIVSEQRGSVAFTVNPFFILIVFFVKKFHESQDSMEKGGGISLTPHYHFHRLHRHLDISRAITAESSPLHISSSRTGTWKLWFPNASRYPLSSASPWFHEIAILRHDKISKGILGLVNCCGFNSVNTKNNVI